MAFSLGSLRVEPPVVLAPMAGVTNLAFRRLCRSFGGAVYVNEMLSARALVEGGEKTSRMARFGDEEAPRSAQLFGVDPAVVAAAARILIDVHGADHIDLNFGCPAPKVTRRGAGSALPLHHVLFGRIVAAAVAAAGPVPITVKLRIGTDDDHRTSVRSGLIAEDAGAAAVALHGRTTQQLYAGAADWSAIAELKQAVTTIPVLGNGDIWEAADALRMVAETGCDGVVVGRGCLGRPWLFQDLDDAFAGRPVRPPPLLGAVLDVLRRHAVALCDLAGEEAGCRDLRKHTGWYVTGYPVGPTIRRSLNQVADLAELDRLLASMDPATALPDGALRIRRGHTNGPRAVALPEGWLTSLDDPLPPAGADLLAAVSGG